MALKGEYYLQILLSSIGDCKNEIYVKKVKEYKALKKAMASAFFKLSKNEKLTPFLKDLSSISSRINSFIENQKKLLSQENPFSSTKIPFYDIVRHKDMSCIEKSPKISADIPIEKKPVPEEYLPRTTDISTILNKEKFHDLVNALPSVLRLCHWHLIYATMTHGTCFEVLFRLAGDYDYPNLLVIKDWKGNVFGAYFNEGWKRKKLFYGAGETFLYTFKTGDDLKVFSWTKRNNYFLLTNGENGICIGAGDYFGLYIHPDLTKGYSYPCETFDNDFLTDNKDFWIERLEVNFF